MVRYRTDSDALAKQQWVSIHTHSKKGNPMLYTIAMILIVLWLLGLVTSFTLGGFIHILLVLAIISILLRVIG